MCKGQAVPRASQRHRARAACTYARHACAPADLSLAAHLSLSSFARRSPPGARCARTDLQVQKEGVVQVSGGQSRSGWTAGRAGLGELRFRSRVAPGRRVPARGALTFAHHTERGELAQKVEKVQAGWVHYTTYSESAGL